MNQRLDCKIDFKTVLTREDLKTLSTEEIEKLRKESNYHYEYFKYLYGNSCLYEILANRSRELAYTSNKYKDLNQTAKEFLISSVIFHNDEQFIRCLLAKKITYNHLFYYSKAISSIKKVVLLANKLEIDEDVKITNKKLNSLCSIIRLYFGVRDYNSILAKINEIVLFKKDLYKKLEQEQFTPDSKTR